MNIYQVLTAANISFGALASISESIVATNYLNEFPGLQTEMY